MSELYEFFESHDDRQICKWEQYFEVYEKHFSRFRDTPLIFLEIGVAAGGSLQMWKKYFGKQAVIIGLDIEPSCFYEEEQIHIEIGDQSNHDFLQSVIQKFGTPDIVLDDGSHQQQHVLSSFNYLYPQMKVGSVYFVEDMHTAYWPEYGGGYKRQETFIETAKSLVDHLNKPYIREQIEPVFFDFTNTTRSISFYDSCVVLEKGEIGKREARKIGKNIDIIEAKF